MSESIAPRTIERDPEREDGRDGVVDNVEVCWKGDIASDKCRESKRLETKTLAGKHASQHEHHEQGTRYAPKPPMPSHKHPKRPRRNPHLPRRRGKSKTRARDVVSTNRLTKCIRTYHERSRRIEAVGCDPDEMQE